MRLSNPLIVVVWLALFFPGRLFPGFEVFFAFAIFLLGVWVMRTKAFHWSARRASRQAALLFGLLAALTMISYLFSAAFKGRPTNGSDWFLIARYVLLGTFVVHLIRHRDAALRRATETALVAFVYLSLGLHLTGLQAYSPFADPDAAGYLAALAYCFLFFFSESPRRLLHVCAALVVSVWSLAQAWPHAQSQYGAWLRKDGPLAAGVILFGVGVLAYRLVRQAPHHRAGAAAMLCLIALLLVGSPFLESVRLFTLTGCILAGMQGDAA